MKLYCFYNTAYKKIFKLFKESLKVDENIELIARKQDFAIDLRNDLTVEQIKKSRYHHCLEVSNRKLDLILEAIDQNENQNIIYSDVDIKIFQPFSHFIEGDLKNNDLLGIQAFSAPRSYLSSAFLAFTCTPKIRHFFSEIKKEINEPAGVSLEKSLNQNLKNLTHLQLSPQFTCSRILANPPSEGGPASPILVHANPFGLVGRRIKTKNTIMKSETGFVSRQGGLHGPTRRERLADMESEILNFFSTGCLRKDGTPFNLDCSQMSESFYEQLNRPGCKSCARRKILKKYKIFIDKLYAATEGDENAPINLSPLND